MTNLSDDYTTYAPDGTEIKIPTIFDLSSDIYGTFATPDAYQTYYQQQGYVIYRNLIPLSLCESLKQTFQDTIKPYQGYLYRQGTGNPEKHEFSPQGYMLNGLLNIQDLESKKFTAFKQIGLDILTYSPLQMMIKTLLGEKGILVQSMFFEGNSHTWPHQDTYYLDADQLGNMVGIWIALEDISAAAGRFFVYPESHHLEIEKNRGKMAIAFHHDTYKKTIIEKIINSQLTCYAPYLRQGDVLFWNARTIHGSLKTDDPTLSRYSLTAHYIPESCQLLQYQKRLISLNLEKVNEVWMHHPKNLDQRYRQLIFQLETHFPFFFQKLKKHVIHWILKDG